MGSGSNWGSNIALLHLLFCSGALSAVTYSVPSSPPSNASQQLQVDPVGVSIEFFAFPGYFNDVASTSTCLENLGDAMGHMPPIRIGGTTQDRATYDPTLTSEVEYTTSSAGAAPTSLTFGPSYMSLAGTYDGNVTIGLNRRLDNVSNTIAAAEVAIKDISTLHSIELGNEPDLYSSSDPIADGSSWTFSRDASSQISWQESVCSALGETDIIQAAVYLRPPTWSTAKLAPLEVSNSADGYVKDFSGHSYPQSACSGSSTDLESLMSHSTIVDYIDTFATEAAAAHAVGKQYVLGETNSATCGGGGISPTFGAGLWIVDYVMQAVLNGVDKLMFHQGTIGNCQYCWWGRYNMGAPYYGAYFAAAALGGADQVVQLDDGTSDYGVYIIYEGDDPVRAVLYNSEYYTSGTRSTTTFTLSNLSSSTVKAKRLTAKYATSRQDRGQNPSFGGQYFANATCVMKGTETYETTTVSNGRASLSVGASEALLVYL